MALSTGELPTDAPATWRGRLLGLFVCWQLIAFPVGSYVKLVPARISMPAGEINGDLQIQLNSGAPASEPYQSAVDATAWTFARWSELTGQSQYWALFSSFSNRACFPVVELAWPDRPPVRLSCYFEPADPTHYFYLPEPKCRLFNYEYRTVVFHLTGPPEDFPSPAEYRKQCIQSVRDRHQSTLAYLRWKSGRYLRDHPDLPTPASVTLIAHVFPNPAPGQSKNIRPPAFEIPVARWSPDRPAEPGMVPFEIWDPVESRYLRLPIGGDL
ncbi:MAG: hypothetical protein K1X57_15030 [Gemmataceae bacterium]|nr:hypothetical protein [Gemmataceae bacterium]